MPCQHIQSPLYMLRNLMHIRNRYSLNMMRLLARFYPVKMLASRDIHAVKKPYHAISLMVKKNDLQKIDDRHLAARYMLTLQGQCRILCDKFGISFLCLCILSEAYALYKLQLKNGCSPSYCLFEIDDLFEGVYSKKAIRNSAAVLNTKNLAFSIFGNMICLEKNTVKALVRHADVLAKLHVWALNVPDCLNRLAVEDSQTLAEIKRLC